MATKIKIGQVSKKLTDWMKNIETRLEKLEKKCSASTIKKHTSQGSPNVTPEALRMVEKAMKEKHRRS